ncbi:hypothetical protein ACJBU6_07211 [Exserohilum turcicum]
MRIQSSVPQSGIPPVGGGCDMASHLPEQTRAGPGVAKDPSGRRAARPTLTLEKKQKNAHVAWFMLSAPSWTDTAAAAYPSDAISAQPDDHGTDNLGKTIMGMALPVQ